LVEELARRVKTACKGVTIDAVAITIPGTVEGNSVVSGSSRLGIHDSIDFTAELHTCGLPPSYVFHDAECLALGEARHGMHKDLPSLAPHKENFAYVLIDEGIGCSLFLDGRVHRGAGVAGHLGRLVVQPNGLYNPTFSSRGPLEVFSSRPWISHNIVAEYLSEKDKREMGSNISDTFRTAVAAAATGDWHGLTVNHIADGMRSRDPIVISVLQDAAQYLSIAINAIITIVNPPTIILGGSMIQDLPDFAESVLSTSRRHAWAGSWNETDIRIASLGRNGQVLGAVELIRSVVNT